MEGNLAIMNQGIFWVVGGLLVVWVLMQATLFVRLAFREAEKIGFPKEKLKTAIGNGAFVAIGPSMASVAVLIALMAVLGGPIAWHRDAVIGAPQTDLAAATMGAEAMGFESLTDPNLTLQGVANAMLIMAINGCGWLILITIFTPHLDKIRVKLSGGDTVWLLLLSTGATLGVFANFSAIQAVQGLDRLTGVIVAFSVQFLMDKFLAERFKWIKAYIIGLALVLGIAAAAFVGANT